jgi:hypothetical protein
LPEIRQAGFSKWESATHIGESEYKRLQFGMHTDGNPNLWLNRTGITYKMQVIRQKNY